jgi:hypothetical protein
MKQTLILLLASALLAYGETEEHLQNRFPAQPEGNLVVDVDFGSIEITTNGSNEVTVDVVRKVSRSSKADEEAFLQDHKVTFSQDANTITVSSRAKTKNNNWGHGNRRTDAKYTISVPGPFNAQLKTAGGSVKVKDLTGDLKAETSGGGFDFERLRGPLNATTSGGGIHMVGCEGAMRVRTSGGAIDVAQGSGSVDAETSGGPVTVKNFHGPAHVHSSGGGLTLENVSGKVSGSTSGGSISARFSSPLSEEVKLETSGGGVTVRVPDSSAFDLDASTSGGSVASDLPVSVTGKANHRHLKGPVNGGGKPVFLRTSGGSIHIQKS